MAGKRWTLKKLAFMVGLALLSILAYYVLLDLVSPHPPKVEYPVPSDLPPGAIVCEGGYVVIPAYNVSLTPEEAAHADFNGTDGQVSFFELPLWIQLRYLPIAFFGAITTFCAAFSIVHRLRRRNNNNKHTILAFVKDNPGCTAPELARDANMNIGTVRYYLQRLEDEGRIVLEKMGKYKRIFVNSNTYNDMEKRIASHLRTEPTKTILASIMESPGINNQRLAEKLVMEKSLVYRYTRKLLEDGIITFEWDGTSKRYFIDASAKETLTRLMRAESVS